MIKKIFFVIFFVVLTVIFFLFIFRNSLTRFFLTRYIKENLKGECVIDKVKLGMNSLKIENLKFINEEVNLSLREGNLDFYFNQGWEPAMSKIDGKEGYLYIKDLQEIKKEIETRVVTAQSPLKGEMSSLRRTTESHLDVHQDKAVDEPRTFTKVEGEGYIKTPREIPQSHPEGDVGVVRGLQVDLENIKIEFVEKGSLSGNIDFSLKMKIDKGNTPVIEEMNVFDSNLQADNFRIEHLTVRKSENTYALTIPLIIIQDKKIKDILIVFELLPKGVRINEIKSKLLGEDAFIRGELDCQDYENICGQVSLSKVSLKDAVHLVDKENSINFEGIFEGEINLCFRGKEFLTVQGSLSNSKGGIINIVKEAPIAFLQKYLDEISYRALVDNFKNYEYNKGEIKVNKHQDAFSVILDFDSEKMGRRNIVLNFIQGGEK